MTAGLDAGAVATKQTIFDSFLAGMNPPDWIQVGLLLIALVALLFTACSFRQQSRSQDVANYLEINRRISDHWRIFANAKDEQKKFEFGEIVNFIEALCHLYNERVIRGHTREMLGEYLRDLIKGFASDKLARQWIAECIYNEKTYDQIRKFAEREGIAELFEYPRERTPKSGA